MTVVEGKRHHSFFEFRIEIKLSLEIQKKYVFVSFFSNEAWLKCLAYLAKISDELNKFYLRLQASETNVLQFKEVLCGLTYKL